MNCTLRAAHGWAGLIREIEIEKIRTWAAASAARDRDQRYQLADRHEALGKRLEALKGVLAAQFGKSRGWKISPTAFSIWSLRLGIAAALPDAAERAARRDRDVIAHPEFFLRHGRAAALAVQLDNWPALGSRCREWAKDRGLVLEVPDFPSWHSPIGARVVLFIGPAGWGPR